MSKSVSGRISDPEYVNARVLVEKSLEHRLVEISAMYDLAESVMTGGGLNVTKTDGIDSTGMISIILSLLAKGLKTSRAIRVVLLEGCGEDAAVLLRSLFETTVAVQWLTREDTSNRVRLYAAHSAYRYTVMRREQAKTKGLEEVGSRHLPHAEAALEQWTQLLGATAMSSVKKHWSGLSDGLTGVCKQLDSLADYNTIYRDTSSYAHVSDPTSHFDPKDNSLGVFKILPGTNECDRVAGVSVVCLHNLAGAVNDKFGLGLDSKLLALHLGREAARSRRKQIKALVSEPDSVHGK